MLELLRPLEAPLMYSKLMSTDIKQANNSHARVGSVCMTSNAVTAPLCWWAAGRCRMHDCTIMMSRQYATQRDSWGPVYSAHCAWFWRVISPCPPRWAPLEDRRCRKASAAIKVSETGLVCTITLPRARHATQWGGRGPIYTASCASLAPMLSPRPLLSIWIDRQPESGTLLLKSMRLSCCNIFYRQIKIRAKKRLISEKLSAVRKFLVARKNPWPSKMRLMKFHELRTNSNCRREAYVKISPVVRFSPKSWFMSLFFIYI